MKNLLFLISVIVLIACGCFLRGILAGDKMPEMTIGQAIIGGLWTAAIGAVSVVLLCGAFAIIRYVIDPPDEKKKKINLRDLIN